MLDWLYGRINAAVRPRRQRAIRRQYGAWAANISRPVQTGSTAQTITTDYLAGWDTRVAVGRGWIDIPGRGR